MEPEPSRLHKVLAEGTALLPASILEKLPHIRPRLQKLETEGNYAGWMELLYKIGLYGEEYGHDREFPPEFWTKIASSANAMKFPEFVAIADGKAEGRPRRIMSDVLASIIVIHREIGERWPKAYPQRSSDLNQIVTLIAAVDPRYPELIRSAARTELSQQFEAAGCNLDPAPKDWCNRSPGRAESRCL